MNTNRLSKELEAILNRQVTKEAEAAQIYLSYGAWADGEGFGGISKYLFRHSQEERNHMMKVIQYIMERGGKVKIEAVKSPPADLKNLQDCFEQTFKHEVENTTAIYEIIDMAHGEKDWATFNFMQWFVKEQIEEEKLVMDLLDKLKIAGGPKATNESLFNLDKYLGKAPGEAPLARDATMENPD